MRNRPRCIPGCSLRICRKFLAKSLKIHFQSFHASGKLPNMLKDGIICFVHKGGIRADDRCYRLICLASHISKATERIVRKNLSTFLEENTSSKHAIWLPSSEDATSHNWCSTLTGY